MNDSKPILQKINTVQFFGGPEKDRILSVRFWSHLVPEGQVTVSYYSAFQQWTVSSPDVSPEVKTFLVNLAKETLVEHGIAL